MHDQHPMDIDSGHPPPPLPTPSPKRRRPNPVPPLTLQSLPLAALRTIVRFLRPIDARLNASSIAHLRATAPLRTLCIRLRDAVDTHITSVDMTDLPAQHVDSFLAMLPRLKAVTTLVVPPHVVNMSFYNSWKRYFTRFTANIRNLTFVDAPPPMCASFSRALIPSLYALNTASANLMTCLPPNSIHKLQLVMDAISVRNLTRCQPQSLSLLYRQGLSQLQARSLVDTLRQCATLQSVQLRINRLPASGYVVFPRIPHLHKLALFDSDSCSQEEHQAGFEALASCAELTALRFEWMDTLTDCDLQTVARGLRDRLRTLTIWNCSGVGDVGLQEVAKWCPRVELELRFVREQFRGATLAMFGERVSWESGL